MNNIEAAEKRLADACLDLAKAVKWRREPFDAKEIDLVAEEFFRISNIYTPYKNGDRLSPRAVKRCSDAVHPTGL